MRIFAMERHPPGPALRHLFSTLFVAVLFGIWSPPTIQAETLPPNIVFILADDLGWADLGCYGADLHETPRLDALAREGVRFTQAYTPSPVCTPTRASMMTGKHPARLRMTTWYEASANPPQDRALIPPVTEGNLPLSEITLAEVLREKGYATAHVGKWHLGDAKHYPENQGFDWNIGGTYWGAPPTFFYPYRGLFGSIREPRYVPRLEGGQPGEYLTDRLTTEALGFIEKTKEAKPFFLYMAYHSVHTPIEAKPEQVEHFEAKLSSDLRHRNPVYAAMAASLDENVGRILDSLTEWGLRDNTLVVFASDNGGYIDPYRDMPMVTSNYPLRSGKGSLYEGGVRVPTLVRWPGVTPSGATCSEPIVTMDFYPTLLAAAGARIPPDTPVDGRDLRDLLRDPQGVRMERDFPFHYPHYYSTTGPVSSLRSGDWKLLHYLEDGKRELFNLREDPSEEHDVSQSEPAKASELFAKLESWRKDLDVQMPVRNPNHSSGK
jgi:arylsulfatase A-like enzyme